MLKQVKKFLLLGLFLSIVLTACSLKPSNPKGSTHDAEGGEGGVEAALVTYSNAAEGFSIGYPSTWSTDTSDKYAVKFSGGDDWMTLEFAKPPAGTDLMTYAKNDIAFVKNSFTGYQQIDLKISSEVKSAVILGFYADGTSSVTGKAYKAHNERYYMPLADGRIAILTVAGPENHYDREGVRDIALTFKITK